MGLTPDLFALEIQAHHAKVGLENEEYHSILKPIVVELPHELVEEYLYANDTANDYVEQTYV